MVMKAVPFSACLYESIGSCCCHSDIGVGVGITLKSFTSDFLCDGKGLTDEDRSCCQNDRKLWT